MTRSVLITCDKEQIDGGQIVGSCAASLVLAADDASPAAAHRHGWLDAGDRQLCPRHNPFPSQGRTDPFPRLRDQAPRPAADRPTPRSGAVTPLRPPRTDGTV